MSDIPGPKPPLMPGPRPDLKGTVKFQIGRLILFGGLSFALAMAVLVVFRSIALLPDWGSAVAQAGSGLLGALFVAGGSAIGAMAVVRGSRALPDPSRGRELADTLASVLAELESLRQDTIRHIAQRAVWRVPVAGFAAMLLASWHHAGKGADAVAEMLFMGAFGALIGYIWAAHRPGREYRDQYKRHILPRLAARFGQIHYRRAQLPDIAALQRQGFFETYQRVEADDELFGSYRGLPLSIIPLTLWRGGGSSSKPAPVFIGLLVTVTLPRQLGGSTTVVPDRGLFGNAITAMRKTGRERVRLEDVLFEQDYQIYGTDQIAARALLTPAFMQRLIAFGDTTPYGGLPLVLTQDNRMTIILPTWNTRNLLNPPTYRQPAACHQTLVSLERTLERLFDTADAVIDLDHTSRTVADQP